MNFDPRIYNRALHDRRSKEAKACREILAAGKAIEKMRSTGFRFTEIQALTDKANLITDGLIKIVSDLDDEEANQALLRNSVLEIRGLDRLDTEEKIA